jgi:hypothetical protein
MCWENGGAGLACGVPGLAGDAAGGACPQASEAKHTNRVALFIDIVLSWQTVKIENSIY